MKKTVLLCALAVTCAAGLRAQQPPVLDRELFFGDPEISGAQISPDGQFIAFLKPWNKTRNIWVKKATEPFESARLLTADTKRPIPGFFWSRDSHYVLFVQDKAGDENYRAYGVSPTAEKAPGSEAPPATDLTKATGARVEIFGLPKSDPDAMFIGLNDRDKAWHDLYKVKISTGERTLVKKNTDRVTSWVFDNKDELRLAVRTTDSGDTEILRVEADGFKKIFSCNVFEQCTPVHFEAGNKRVYMVSNKGDVDLLRLELFDPENGKEEVVESDPEKRVDFGDAVFSDLTDKLLGTIYEDDRSRVYWRDKGYEADYKLLQKKLPGLELGYGSHTKDEQVWIISASGDTEPGQTYLFDRRTKKLTLQYRLREALPRDALAKTEAIRYKSSDGLEIPAYLTLPKGVPAQNLALIVFPHGGPWGRDTWGFQGYAQFLANRGYAVLQPNFRGSTGYGKKFLDAGNKQWGEKMQDDLTWGVRYLIDKGTVSPKRAGIMGGSYGGYATLAGVAFTPDLYAAAVAIVAPSNLISLLETIPPYWEAQRAFFRERMGDTNTAEGKAQLARQSPLNSAGKIKTPLMVVQGANDPRVNKREADQIVIALRDRGFPVEYLVAPDEGHGFRRPVNNMAMMAAAEKFLAHYLDGRYQEGGTPEVIARLKEITVDPKTVVIAKSMNAAAVGLPVPDRPLEAGVYSYNAVVKMGSNEIKMKLSTEIKEDQGQWVAIDRMETPMGEMSDSGTLDKKTLSLLSRSVAQGPVTIDLHFQDGKATGKLSMNGQDKPIAADLGGALYGDGPASSQVLAALPLQEGYSATFRNFDPQTQKAKLMQLKVTGVEQVTVPAGEFSAFRVEIGSADGGNDKGTLWVAKDSRKAVKLEVALPQMGGATMTLELLN